MHSIEANDWVQRTIDFLEQLEKGADLSILHDRHAATIEAGEICSESGLTRDSINALKQLSTFLPEIASRCGVSPDFFENRVGVGFSLYPLLPERGRQKFTNDRYLENIYSYVEDFSECPDAHSSIKFYLDCGNARTHISSRTVAALKAALNMKNEIIGILASQSMWYADGTLMHTKAAKALEKKLSPSFRDLPSVEALVKYFRVKPGSTQPKKNNGQEFETKLEAVFTALDVPCERTPVTGDFGVDLIISIGSKRIAVQAKDHAAAIGVSAVMAVTAGARHYQCTDAAVISKGDFTPAALELARTTGTTLLSEGALLQMLRDRVHSLF
ncbi:restriction endonuclease [Caballeronia telluris]|nr:restriction endonuclease [Caballeronia telluris]